MSKSSSPTAPTSTDRRDQRRKLTGIVLGLTPSHRPDGARLATPALNSGAKDLPLAVNARRWLSHNWMQEIAHVNVNCFYASAERALNPEPA